MFHQFQIVVAVLGINLDHVIDSILGALGASSVTDLDWCSREELLQWADDAAKRLAVKAGVFTEYDPSGVLVALTSVYPVPVGHVDTIKVFSVRSLRPLGVRELNALDYNWQSTLGTPRYVSMDAQGAGFTTFYPCPVIPGTFSTLYHRYPAVSLFVLVPLPVQSYYAFYMLLEARRKESDRAMLEMADHFESRVKLFEQLFEHLYGPSS